MKGFLRSFVFAFHGIRFAMQGRNFRVQLAIAAMVIIAAATLGVSHVEWMIILLLVGLVLSLETINSVIENIVNFISPEYDPLAGKIKDMAAGAVLIMSIIAAIIGLIIFLPYLMGFLF